jgi:hypothetical protein
MAAKKKTSKAKASSAKKKKKKKTWWTTKKFRSKVHADAKPILGQIGGSLTGMSKSRKNEVAHGIAYGKAKKAGRGGIASAKPKGRKKVTKKKTSKRRKKKR